MSNVLDDCSVSHKLQERKVSNVLDDCSVSHKKYSGLPDLFFLPELPAPCKKSLYDAHAGSTERPCWAFTLDD